MAKLFSVAQIKEWDNYTIQHDPVSSINLMERAAYACTDWIKEYYDSSKAFIIFCGRGNNGGDGLAIARLLLESQYRVLVYVVGEKSGSRDFEKNLDRLNSVSNAIYFLNEEKPFPAIGKEIVIDALFGTGLHKKPEGIFSDLIAHINKNKLFTISIDLPSGLFADASSAGNEIIHADYTLSFQSWKLAFVMPENAKYVGHPVILDINLSPDYYNKESSQFEMTDVRFIREIYKRRKPNSNKGNYGYACLLAGSYGMMGAAVLSARSCLRSGVGKLTCYNPEIGYNIIQTAVPEAMCKTFGIKVLEKTSGYSDFEAIGIGPGIGDSDSHKDLLKDLFENYQQPIVIDADALNVLSKNKFLYDFIPSKSIITPHPKEFERLFGKSDSDFDRVQLALTKSKELDIYIVLKGHHTFIATPEGKGYFNNTGNAGMATAGAGDVLTGIITGLLAQKYSSLEACQLGVFLHGLAGDFAATAISEEALIAGDIIDYMGKCFKEIANISLKH
ncbi:MAG: NAD(P)H-hydrate dehydratase [Ginsengibacter sp.]